MKYKPACGCLKPTFINKGVDIINSDSEGEISHDQYWQLDPKKITPEELHCYTIFTEDIQFIWMGDTLIFCPSCGNPVKEAE